MTNVIVGDWCGIRSQRARLILARSRTRCSSGVVLFYGIHDSHEHVAQLPHFRG